jgi:hypothetical protein
MATIQFHSYHFVLTISEYTTEESRDWGWPCHYTHIRFRFDISDVIFEPLTPVTQSSACQHQT